MNDDYRRREGVADSGSVRPEARASAPPPTPSSQECCDRCGSVRLIRVKACWRCESCGYKSDCNGW
jgi:ribosomal protein L37AE/L43A